MADIFNIGISALLSTQRVLSTVGHNIANANTPDYSRQRVGLVTRDPRQLLRWQRRHHRRDQAAHGFIPDHTGSFRYNQPFTGRFLQRACFAAEQHAGRFDFRGGAGDNRIFQWNAAAVGSTGLDPHPTSTAWQGWHTGRPIPRSDCTIGRRQPGGQFAPGILCRSDQRTCPVHRGDQPQYFTEQRTHGT